VVGLHYTSYTQWKKVLIQKEEREQNLCRNEGKGEASRVLKKQGLWSATQVVTFIRQNEGGEHKEISLHDGGGSERARRAVGKVRQDVR